MSVARSYAKALFEAVLESKMPAADLNKIEIQLGSLIELLGSSKDLRTALFSPATSAREKMALMHELQKKLEFLKPLENFILLLARKKRLPLLSDIRDAFGAVRLEAAGGVRGTLISADLLSDQDGQNLAKAFSQKLGKKVVFKTFLDPSLLAGVKVTVNGVTYDGSLRAQLQRLRDRLVFGSSQVH